MELEEAMEWLSNRAHVLSFFSDRDSRDTSEAIRTVLAALEWRPIAGADPLDEGTEVLLFVPRDGWSDDCPGEVYIASIGYQGDWNDRYTDYEGATHYRLVGPLPVVKP